MKPQERRARAEALAADVIVEWRRQREPGLPVAEHRSDTSIIASALYLIAREMYRSRLKAALRKIGEYSSEGNRFAAHMGDDVRALLDGDADE